MRAATNIKWLYCEKTKNYVNFVHSLLTLHYIYSLLSSRAYYNTLDDAATL